MAFTTSPRPLIGIRYPVWSSYGPQVMEGVTGFMQKERPWRLATENGSYGEMEPVKMDRHWKGDGLILFRAAEEELRAFRKRGQAVVLTSTEGPDLGYPRVVPDNGQIGRLAAEHLVECSLSQCAFLARGDTLYREAAFAPGQRRYARERLAGFRAALGEWQIQPRVEYLEGRPLWMPETWRQVEADVVAFLKTLPVPCGLFVVDDALGAVVLRAAEQAGRSVPGDLAVLAFGNDPAYCYAARPTLSSIPYPGREIGRIAADLIQRQLEGGTPPALTTVAVRPVIPRESSETIGVEDPGVREVMRYIRRHAPHDPIRVAELAEHSGLSFTTLKHRFAAALGHGPKQEIQRVRLRHLQHLLRNTNQPLADIARQMKFGSAHELSRFFLAETGRRPGHCRGGLSAS